MCLLWWRAAVNLTNSISEVTQADSGNYTCEVRAPQSKVIGRITHYVYVRGVLVIFCC